MTFGFIASARDGDALLLAAGELARIGVSLVGQADACEQLARRVLGLLLRDVADLDRGQHDVLEHRHVWEQVEALEDHADFLAYLVDVSLAVEHDAIDADFAGSRLFEVVHAAQQRALARAGRPDNDDDLFLLNCEVDALEHLDVTK